MNSVNRIQSYEAVHDGCEAVHGSVFVPDALHFRRGPIAVLGAGLSGQAVTALIQSRQGEARLFDARPDFPDFTQADASACPVVVYSPGFAQDHPWIQCAREAGSLTISELHWSRAFWKGPFIAVTGTNGKTSLTRLLTQALQKMGKTVFACGNIGIPLSQCVQACQEQAGMGVDGAQVLAVAVCEVSSFQLEEPRGLPCDDVLWGHFASDHLDRHKDLERYFKIKWRLTQQVAQAGGVFLSQEILDWAQRFGLRCPDQAKVLSAEEALELPEQGFFARRPQSMNYALAAHYWRHQGYPLEALKACAEAFVPDPYRLSEVARVGKLGFWNDSKATNLDAALAALRSFQGHQIYWIGGGLGKGEALDPFLSALPKNLAAAFCIGKTGEILAKGLNEAGIDAIYVADLERAAKAAFELARASAQEAVVLLSPGFASKDQFEDYCARGRRFDQVVSSLTDGEPLGFD